MDHDFSYFKNRKTIYEVLGLIFGIFAGFCLLTVFVSLEKNNGSSSITAAVGFLGGFLGVIFVKYRFKILSTEFKETFVEGQLRKVFPNSVYNARTGFTKSEVYNSNVLKREDRFESEDMITGKFENVKFRSSDVTLKDVSHSGKHTTVVTVFQGRVYEFEFNKRFKSNLLLIQPGKFRIFGPWKKIKMESVHFNSELKVYAENDHEAFYILTPHFMEKLLYLDKKYRDKVNFSFINRKLYISVDSRRDTFDLKLFGEISSQMVNDFVYEFEDMKEFIIKLKLDNKIFMQGKEY